jgi:hypothetical protein
MWSFFKNNSFLLHVIKRVYYTVVKSISCVGDANYKPLKYLLAEKQTQELIDTMRRLITFVLKISTSKYNELIFGPSKLIYL